jgi:PleD family two-component response regulator
MEENHNPVVLAAVDDLFFSVKIESAARQLEIQLILAPSFEQLVKYLEALVPEIVILDLNSRACAPFDAIRHIKSNPRFSKVHTLGFYPHMQVELQREAKEAGCDQIIPRSLFSSKMLKFLIPPV